MTARLAPHVPVQLASRVHAQKNCVAVIASLSALMARSPGAALDRANLEVLRETAARLQALLLDDVRSALGAETVVQLDEIVSGVVREASPLAEQGSVELAVSLEAAPVWGDRALLQEAVRNVILNAIQGAPPGTPVSIDVRFRQEISELVVRNAERDGERPDAAATSTGLGLPIARRIVASHLGTLSMRRGQGQVRVVMRLGTDEEGRGG
jgi:signal transduction histidine kinase